MTTPSQDPDSQRELGFLAAFERAQRMLSESGHTLTASEACLLNMINALMRTLHAMSSSGVVISAEDKARIQEYLSEGAQQAEELGKLWFPDQA